MYFTQPANLKEIDLNNLDTSATSPYMTARAVLVNNNAWTTLYGEIPDTSSLEYKIIRDFTLAACRNLPVCTYRLTRSAL